MGDFKRQGSVVDDLRLDSLQRKLGATEIFFEKYSYADNGKSAHPPQTLLRDRRANAFLYLRQRRSAPQRLQSQRCLQLSADLCLRPGG